MNEELMLLEKVIINSNEREDCKTGCKFIWSNFQLGGWPEHDDYAARAFGSRKEVVVITRDGEKARYDGGMTYPDPVTTVGEVKTGRRWSANPPSQWSSVQNSIFTRDMLQFDRQERVARKCKLQYQIFMKEQVGFQGYSLNTGRFAPFLLYRP
jgi:hypothetical protein